MTKLKWTLVSTLLVVLCAACDGNGNGMSINPDAGRIAALEAQVATLGSTVTDLQAQLAGAAANRPAVFIRSAGATAAAAGARSVRAAETAGTACDGLGTLTGRPTTGDPIRTALVAGVSCTGYLFVLEDDGTSATLARAPANAVFYESFDCTGQPYVSLSFNNSISPAALNQGAVLRVGVENLAIPAGSLSAPAVPVILGSFLELNGCATSTGTLPIDAVALVPNDPMVTGVTNAIIPGPLVVAAAP